MRATWITTFVAFIGFFGALLLTDPQGVSALMAQEKPATASEKTADRAAAEPKPAEMGSATLWERLIYLPYKQLKDVFEKQEGSVFLPYREYLELWQRAGQKDPAPEVPPVDAVITESRYTARVDKDVVRIEAELSVQVLAKPWAQTSVRFGDTAVGKITSSGDKVLLRGMGKGVYSLLFPGRGDYKVQLQLATQVRTSPDGKSFDFVCPSVGVTTFEVIVPQADQTVTITPGGVPLSTEAGEKETRTKVSLGSTSKIAAQWHPRVSERPDMELLAAVTNHSLVSVRDGLIHTDAYLSYDILRGETSQVQIVLPLAHRILGVTSPDAKVRGWNAQAEAKRQLVTIDFLGSIEKKVTLEIHSERPSPEDGFNVAGVEEGGVVHGIHALNAVRESGQVVVTHSPDLSMAVEQQRGVIRIDAGEVAAAVKRPNSLSYKFYSPQFQLKVSTRPVEPRIQVDHRTRLVFTDDELRLKADLDYSIERAGVFELRLNLPADLTVDTVIADGLKEFNADKDAKVLTVALDQKRQGSLHLTVTGHRSLDSKSGETDQMLPLLEPVGMERETGQVAVYAPEAIELISDDEKLVAAQPEPLQQGERLPNVRLAASWSYSRRPVAIPIRTIRRPTRLSANVATTITAKPELAEVVTQLEYMIEFAGVDTFRFSVPEPVADDVQIRSLASSSAPAIKQKSRAEDAEDGWVVWTVVMQRDVVGRQKFEISYDLKAETGQPADAASDADAEKSDEKEPGDGETDATKALHEYAVQTIRVLGLPKDDKRAGGVVLSQVSGEIAVLKDRALSVSATPLDDDFEAIDVRELTLLPQNGSLAYRYFRQPVGLKIVSTRHEIEKVVETVVSRALVEVVLGHDKTATYRCRYQLKSSERQRLRLDLPKGIDLLGLSVDRRLVNPEKNETARTADGFESFFVNVARARSSDEPFWLTAQFQMPLEAAFEDWGGRWNLPLPRLGGRDESRVALQELRAVVWVPDEYALVGTPDSFVRSMRVRIPAWGRQYVSGIDQASVDGWIGGETGGVFDFPVAGHAYQYCNLGGADRLHITWWDLAPFTWLCCGALVLIAWILRRTSWENKLGLLLLATFASAAALHFLEAADLIVDGLVVARYGMAAMLAIWVIHAVLGTRHVLKQPSPAEPAGAAGAAQEVVAPEPPSSGQTEPPAADSLSDSDSSEST